MFSNFTYKPLNDFVYQKFAQLAQALQADSRPVKEGNELIANNSDFVMHKLFEMQEHATSSLIPSAELNFLIEFLLSLDTELAYSRSTLRRASDIINKIILIDRLEYLRYHHRGYHNEQNKPDECLIINLGSYVHADSKCLQTVPLYARELAHKKQVTIINVDYAFRPADFFGVNYQTKNLSVYQLAADIDQVSDLKFLINRYIATQQKVIISSFTSAIKCPLHYQWVADVYQQCHNEGLMMPIIMAGYHDNSGANALLIEATNITASNLAANYSHQVASHPIIGTGNLNGALPSEQAAFKENMRAAGWEILPGNTELHLCPVMRQQIYAQHTRSQENQISTSKTNETNCGLTMRLR